MKAPVALGDPTPPYDTTCPASGSVQVEVEHVSSTDHVSVVDRWGNAVSSTSTNVSSSGVVVPGYGFFLDNEMTNFNPQPLFEGDPNLAETGKRPRGNMAPTLVVRDGHPVLSIGVAGGQTIQTTVLGILVNHLDFGMPLPEALAAALRRAEAGLRLVENRDLAGELRAFLDLDLGVADLARDLAGAVDGELLAHRQLAFEAAVDLGVVDRDGALEHAVLRDLEHARVERGFHAAFDHQRVAVGDLGAFHLDVGADDQLRFLALFTLFRGEGRGCHVGGRHGRGSRWLAWAEQSAIALVVALAAKTVH